jgi:hypothetical protein
MPDSEPIEPCPGCDARDRISARLAARVDELEAENERLKRGENDAAA